MSFRIFLLVSGLALSAALVQAQETAPAMTTGPTAADSVAQAKDDPLRPLTPEDILTVGVPKTLDERNAMAQQAQDLRADSQQRKEDAEKVHTAAKTACWKKFLVSACLDDARVAYRQTIQAAKKQDRKAQALERNVRKYDAAEHIKQRDEENAQRDADNARKAADYRAKQAGKNQ
ncbi:MAG TPA: hypothetical protein VL550_02085 [Rhodocyclaceae bacterium]|nr:hypothetical protein [Rhodocyclaceae bacterium]